MYYKLGRVWDENGDVDKELVRVENKFMSLFKGSRVNYITDVESLGEVMIDSYKKPFNNRVEHKYIGKSLNELVNNPDDCEGDMRISTWDAIGSPRVLYTTDVLRVCVKEDYDNSISLINTVLTNLVELSGVSLKMDTETVHSKRIEDVVNIDYDLVEFLKKSNSGIVRSDLFDSFKKRMSKGELPKYDSNVIKLVLGGCEVVEIGEDLYIFKEV